MFGFKGWWGIASRKSLETLTIRKLRTLTKSAETDLTKNGTMSYSAQITLVEALRGMVDELAAIRMTARLDNIATNAALSCLPGSVTRVTTLLMLADRYPILEWVLWAVVTPFVRMHEREIAKAAEEAEIASEKISG